MKIFQKSNLFVIINPNLKGDKVKLNQNSLNLILEMNLLQNAVLAFCIQFRKLKSYCTVLEYTAGEGTIEMSILHAENLAVKEGDVVQIESMPLEKCRYASLTPLSSNYLQINDMRSLLESHLRQYYSTLYKNQLISVGFGRGEMVEFRVSELQPDDACICLNTDIEIDIKPEDDSMALSALQSRNGAVSTLKEWVKNGDGSRIVFKNVKVDTSTVFKVPLVSKVSKYSFDLEIFQGDSNIYISDINETPSIIDHLFMSVEQGSRKFEVDIGIDKGGFMYITVEKYGLACECTLVIETVEPGSSSSQLQDTPTDQIVDTAGVDKEECGNCHLLIPSRTITTHFAYCSRNNQPCPKCHKVFLKKDFENHWHCEQCSKVGDIQEREKHVEFSHQFVTCSCAETLLPPQISQHKIVECEDRFIICRYCHLLLRAGKFSKTAKDLILGLGLTEHESECGARTFECQRCLKSVQLKDMQIHLKTHEIMKQNLPLVPFNICSNKICGNPQNEQYKNPLKLCTLCFKPFWSPRHDETNQKVPQKVIETYHHQLTVGCGRDGCWNLYCCTSSDKSVCKDGPLLPNDSAVIAIDLFKSSAVVKPKDPVYYFCVADKIISNRILTAARLKEMSGDIYRLEYCVKALIESREDVTSALFWLSKNAPKTSTS